jgi:hypothetical protein
VYMLIGNWPGETHEDREYRRQRLRDFGALPYPMPYVRTPELVGFQRWVVRRADLVVPWEEYRRADFRPERLRSSAPEIPLFSDRMRTSGENCSRAQELDCFGHDGAGGKADPLLCCLRPAMFPA